MQALRSCRVFIVCGAMSLLNAFFGRLRKKDYSLGNFIGNLDAMIYILLITITSLVEVLYPIVTGLSLYSST